MTCVGVRSSLTKHLPISAPAANTITAATTSVTRGCPNALPRAVGLSSRLSLSNCRKPRGNLLLAMPAELISRCALEAGDAHQGQGDHKAAAPLGSNAAPQKLSFNPPSFKGRGNNVQSYSLDLPVSMLRLALVISHFKLHANAQISSSTLVHLPWRAHLSSR